MSVCACVCVFMGLHTWLLPMKIRGQLLEVNSFFYHVDPRIKLRLAGLVASTFYSLSHFTNLSPPTPFFKKKVSCSSGPQVCYVTENVHNFWSSCLYFSSRRMTVVLHQLVLFLLALGNTLLFFIMAAPMCIHTSNVLGFLFCIPLPSSLYWVTSSFLLPWYQAYPIPHILLAFLFTCVAKQSSLFFLYMSSSLATGCITIHVCFWLHLFDVYF